MVEEHANDDPAARSIAVWLSIGAVLACVVLVVVIATLASGGDVQLASNVMRMAEHRPPLQW